MIRINLYGGPGAGKSTMAARIFAELKNRNYKVELVREVVKDWAYEDRRPDTWDQIYLFGCQMQEEYRLEKAGVPLLVTDSPLLLQCSYAGINASELISLTDSYDRLHPSINFMVDRTKPYCRMGRFQTREEAIALDLKIVAFLKAQKVQYWSVSCYENALEILEKTLPTFGL